MYKFIDVNEASEGLVLPSEALKINGEYIENIIGGYRTLNVSGREALSPDVLSYTVGIRDGSKLQSKRYPERIITVTYQLVAATNEEFREAYNQLGRILDVEDAELIFNDEQDKFFTGTPCTIGSVPPGKNSVIGNFEILCTDPFKYSVVEYEAEPDLSEGSILIDYGGTYKAYPKLAAEFYNETESSEDGETVQALTGAGDCGFVAFFTEDEKIVQLGDPDEIDGETEYSKSQTLINAEFTKSTSWGTAAKSQWLVNADKSGGIAQTGAMSMGVASYAVPSNAADTSGTLLTVTSRANAPLIHYKLTAKATNRTESTVKVTVSIKTWLNSSGSFFGRGYALKGSLYIGGKWHDVTLKTTSERWSGTSGHTKNITVTVSGLDASATALTGIKFKVTRPDGLGTAGKLNDTTCSNLAISKYSTATPETYYLKSSYGSGNDWHGTSITRKIPGDGVTDFSLTFSQEMAIGENGTNQIGAFRAAVFGGSGDNRRCIAGVDIYKLQPGKIGVCRLNIGGITHGEMMEVDLSHNGTVLTHGKSSTIKKSGDVVTFTIGGTKWAFSYPETGESVATEVTFAMYQKGNLPVLTHNGLYSAKFVKDFYDFKEIPNKFSAGDVVEADCRDGEIYLNGVSTPALGAIGNNWEDFVLTPGLNQIGIAYSDWFDDPQYAPKMKVRYREVFL